MAGNDKMTSPMTPGIGGVEGLSNDIATQNILKQESVREKTKNVEFDYDLDELKKAPGNLLKSSILKPFTQGKGVKESFKGAYNNIKSLKGKDLSNSILNAGAQATMNYKGIEATVFANRSPRQAKRRRGYVTDTFNYTDTIDRPHGYKSEVPKLDVENQQIGFMVNIPINFSKKRR